MENCPAGWDQQVYGDEIFWVKTSGQVVSLLGRGPALDRGASLDRQRRLSVVPTFPFDVLVSAQQVHGSSIVVLGGEVTESAGRHDGLFSTLSGRGVGIWTADCVPVLLSGGDAVAAIHAGWRGAVSGIIPEAIDLFLRESSVKPTEVSATIGPAIGACHYPVGSEVITALESSGPSDHSWLQPGGVDLRRFVHRQLLDLGLRQSAVEVVGPCTACDPQLASFRRDGQSAGRQISIIGLTAS